MEKTILLAKSNFRKNKGTSVGLFLLMFMAAMLVGVSLLIFLDAYPTAAKEAKRLDAGDGYLWIGEDLRGIDDEFIEDLFFCHFNKISITSIFLCVKSRINIIHIIIHINPDMIFISTNIYFTKQGWLPSPKSYRKCILPIFHSFIIYKSKLFNVAFTIIGNNPISLNHI